MFTRTAMTRVAIGSVAAFALATPMAAHAQSTAPAGDDIAPLYRANSKTAIPGKYVVVLKNDAGARSEEHTSELQSRGHLVCRLLLEKKKKQTTHERIDTLSAAEHKHR